MGRRGRRRRFGVAARRLRKRQEPLSPGVWRRKPSARHPGRAGNHFRGSSVMQVSRMALVVSAMLASFQSLAQGKERPMQHPTFYRTTQIDGLSIFYREAGPKDAPTLL